MTQKVKAAPERPQAQTKVAPPVVQAPPTKKRNLKRKETILYHAEYEIPKNAGIVYMLPQKGITVYDSDKDTVREMR